MFMKSESHLTLFFYENHLTLFILSVFHQRCSTIHNQLNLSHHLPISRTSFKAKSYESLVFRLTLFTLAILGALQLVTYHFVRSYTLAIIISTS
jgi:hypothetical protein